MRICLSDGDIEFVLRAFGFMVGYVMSVMLGRTDESKVMFILVGHFTLLMDHREC